MGEEIYEEALRRYQHMIPIPRVKGDGPLTPPELRALVAHDLWKIRGGESTCKQMDDDDNLADLILGIAPEKFRIEAQRRLQQLEEKTTPK